VARKHRSPVAQLVRASDC